MEISDHEQAGPLPKSTHLTFASGFVCESVFPSDAAFITSQSTGPSWLVLLTIHGFIRLIVSLANVTICLE